MVCIKNLIFNLPLDLVFVNTTLFHIPKSQYSNIPAFHYSMSEEKVRAIKIPFNFNKL